MGTANCYDCLHHHVCKHTLVGRGKNQVPVKSDADVRPLLTELSEACATHCKHYWMRGSQDA